MEHTGLPVALSQDFFLSVRQYRLPTYHFPGLNSMITFSLRLRLLPAYVGRLFNVTMQSLKHLRL